MVKIAGSFLKIQNDDDKIVLLDNVCDLIHVDVMDGKFTERATIPLDRMKDVILSLKKPFDVHLMVNDLKKYIDEVSLLSPYCIIFHLEACDDADKWINYIHSKGIKAGIAINPDTPVSSIYPYLNDTDLVLVMSVKAGAGGQSFIDITDKLTDLIQYRMDNNGKYEVEVDGGINDNTIRLVRDADIVVAGSYITDSDNYQSQVYKLKKALRNGFTLAELLGVIVILSILGLVAVTAIDSNLKESRYDSCMVQKNNIIEGAKMLMMDYPDLLPDAGSSTIINVTDLQNGGEINGQVFKGGYIDSDLENPMTDKPYADSTGGVNVVVTTANGQSFSYDVEFGNTDENCHK